MNLLKSYDTDLLYSRAKTPMSGTFWRPLKQITRNGEALTGDQLRDYAASSTRRRSVAVQNPYNSYRMSHEFSLDSETFAIVSEGVGSIAAASRSRIKPLAVVHRGVRIRNGVEIGSGAEIMPYATIESGVTIGSGSVIGKRTRINSPGLIGKNVYVGPGSTIGVGSEVQDGSVFYKYDNIGRGAKFGEGCITGRDVRIGNGLLAGDDIRIGHHAIVRDGVVIGDRASILPLSVLNNNALIGVDAVVGEHGAVIPFGWVKAGGREEGPHGALGNPLLGKIIVALSELEEFDFTQ